MQTIFTLLLLFAASLLLILIVADVWISFKARRLSYQEVQAMPVCNYALLLGTAKYLGEQKALNRYYRYRLEAALELWHAGKVKQFVVSGSGLHENISETVCMQADLVAGGVPTSAVWQDPAGLRTLDSVIRFRQQFGQASVCIVSQPFHNQRALVQAGFHELNAIAYNAQIVGLKAGHKIHLRERFARLRLWYDLARHTPPLHSLAEVPISQHRTEHGA